MACGLRSRSMYASRSFFDPNTTQPRAGRMIFVGSTSDDAQEIRNILQQVHPDWLYNWQPDGISALDYMINHGLPDIALINANIHGTSAKEVVDWIRASPSPHYIPTVIYDVQIHLESLLDCRVDAIVSDTDLGLRDLIKITDQLIRRIRSQRSVTSSYF